MVELKLVISEVDYDAVIAKFGGVAGLAAKALPKSAKEELAVKYLNQNAGKLTQKLEALAGQKGVTVRVASAQAKVL